MYFLRKLGEILVGLTDILKRRVMAAKNGSGIHIVMYAKIKQILRKDDR
jgi:hypothetical protein